MKSAGIDVSHETVTMAINREGRIRARVSRVCALDEPAWT